MKRNLLKHKKKDQKLLVFSLEMPLILKKKLEICLEREACIQVRLLRLFLMALRKIKAGYLLDLMQNF
jgi:hypothetical protein